MIPGVDQLYSADEDGLLHYMANPNAMHRNHCISLDDMTMGTASSWLCGEAAGNYQPWRYPFIWRPLNAPLNSGPNIYGAWPDGGHFCLTDGSVRFFSNTTDATSLTLLANAPPVAAREQTIVPDHRTERLSLRCDVNGLKQRLGRINIKAHRTPQSLLIAPTDRTSQMFSESATMICQSGMWITPFAAICRECSNTSQRIWMLDVSVVNDENAAIIAQFPDLEFLQASTYDRTEKGDAILKSCPKLKTIVHR